MRGRMDGWMDECTDDEDCGCKTDHPSRLMTECMIGVMGGGR